MKKILVIDDSALMRRAISDIIESTNEYCVAYSAKDGVEGLEIIENNHDIATVFCDINMPRMSGLELLQVLKRKNIDIPIVIFSSSDDTDDTITALQLGAIEFIKKPERILGRSSVYFEKRVMKALDIASNVQKVAPTIDNKNESKKKKSEKTNSEKKKSKKKTSKLIAVCCSTGGPRALQSVLPYIPANIAAPIVLVQHMPVGFTGTLAERLNELSQITVKEAENYETLKNGVCYIAKGGTHLTVEEKNGVPRIVFDDSPAVVGLKPCGNIMYNSLCDLSYDEIVCVILTGMGADGTKGILKLSQHKDVYVIAQDEKSSTVYGMPKAIYERGLTDCVCDINSIAKEITKKVGVL
ncbi:MAG: chemotaxis-specific protein-glutamate methyltransferase CheB [Lachnospiraceae bacterium]|nr:chemotaxis-specific protein-glutamate methyltransferase CheB [Lachnospiraceae bacterium]